MNDLYWTATCIFSFAAGAAVMGYKAIRHLHPRPQPLGRLDALRVYLQPKHRRWPATVTARPPLPIESARRAELRH
jgi:hypothetical protein